VKKKLERYPSVHQVSPFCEIGSFRDILHFNGHDLSIPMVFGISGAMGFAYGPGYLARPIAPDYYLPIYVITPFNPFPLRNTYRVTNVWTYGRRSIDSGKMWKTIVKYINEERPVLVEVEISNYFRLIGMPLAAQSFLYIGGHVVTVIGYDEENRRITVVESMLKNPVEVDMDQFIQVCSVFDSYVPPENEWTVHYVPPKLPPVEFMIYQGIRGLVHQMLHPYQFSPHHYFGFDGLKKFVTTFQDWPELMNKELLMESLSLANNFVQQYRNGGFLRRLYAKFLLEAADMLRDDRLKNGADLYLDSMEKWNSLSNLISESLKDQTKGVFARENRDCVHEILTEIFSAEERGIEYLNNTLDIW